MAKKEKQEEKYFKITIKSGPQNMIFFWFCKGIIKGVDNKKN